jgi:hypothetical protein
MNKCKSLEPLPPNHSTCRTPAADHLSCLIFYHNMPPVCQTMALFLLVLPTCILYGFKHFMAIIGTLKKQYQTAVAMNLKLYNLFLRDQLFHLKDSKTFWEC